MTNQNTALQASSSNTPMKLFVVALLSSLENLNNTTDKLVFRPFMHQPRIYHGAPAGVHVTTIHAYDPENPRNDVIYNLPNVMDYDFYVLDKTTGNLTTSKYIDRSVGDTYEVMVAAVSQGISELEQLQITVTEFNQFAPRFEHQIFKADLNFETEVNTTVLQLRAVDPDPIPQNAEIYYKMDQNASTRFFSLDPETGLLTLARSLNISERLLSFSVFAEDGGSPKRWAQVQVKISLKTISAPLNLTAINITVTSATVCWSYSELGEIIGYSCRYRLSRDTKDMEKNVTSTNTHMCTTLLDLQPGEQYTIYVVGWNEDEVGQQTPFVNITTKPYRCFESICKPGDCITLEADPWYQCNCGKNYFGAHCEFFDSCSDQPCKNNSTCFSENTGKATCICNEGYGGPNCEIFNPCSLGFICENGGTCVISDEGQSKCLCLTGFHGYQCEIQHLCLPDRCLNGGTCSTTTNGSIACSCSAGFTGVFCDLEVDACSSNPCYGRSVCANFKGHYTCICTTGYTGNRCDEKLSCIQDIVETAKGIFKWKSTSHGLKARHNCPLGALNEKGGNNFAERSCLLFSNGTAGWGEVKDDLCRGKDHIVAEKVVEELHSWTSRPGNQSIESIAATTKKLADIATVATQELKLAQEMVNVISNVMNVDNKILGEKDGELSDRMLQVVDNLASNVPLKLGERISLKTDNIFVQAVQWHANTTATEDKREMLEFEASLGNGQKQKTNIPMNATESIDSDVTGGGMDKKESEVEKMRVYLPVETLEKVQEERKGDIRVKFCVFYNHKFFQPKEVKPNTSFTPKVLLAPSNNDTRPMNNASKDTSTGSPRSSSVAIPILQISVNNDTIFNLVRPLVYIFPVVTNETAECVFWVEEDRIWSTDGIKTNQTDKFVICESSHLTAFSVLFDPTPYVPLEEIHEEILTILSIVGCVISLIGLSLTIVTYSLFRCLNRDNTGKILLNISVSLFFLNVSFLLGCYKPLHPKAYCQTMAFLVHFFLLSSLSWMCVEACNMYNLLIRVFVTSESNFLLKRFLGAYGMPLLIVSITASLGLDDYYDENGYCVLPPRNLIVYYTAFILPCCVILVINTIVFLMVSEVLFAPRLSSRDFRRNDPPISMAQVRGAFTVMVLLGVTWVLGTFAVNEARLVFQYFFCILNSLQGFLIFLVRCIMYPEAKNAWMQLIKYGTLKKYRGSLPPGAVSWSTSSQNTRKRNDQNTSTTRKSSSDPGFTGPGSRSINTDLTNRHKASTVLNSKTQPNVNNKWEQNPSPARNIENTTVCLSRVGNEQDIYDRSSCSTRKNYSGDLLEGNLDGTTSMPKNKFATKMKDQMILKNKNVVNDIQNKEKHNCRNVEGKVHQPSTSKSNIFEGLSCQLENYVEYTPRTLSHNNNHQESLNISIDGYVDRPENSFNYPRPSSSRANVKKVDRMESRNGTLYPPATDDALSDDSTFTDIELMSVMYWNPPNI